jgi:hypothetical protein
MPSYPNDRSNNPLYPIEYGRRWNFFQKLQVTVGTFNTPCDMLITFPTQTVTFFLEGSGSNQIQYSFDGYYIDGDMTFGLGSQNLTFTNRVISKIWFQAISGTPTVRVEAWAVR